MVRTRAGAVFSVPSRYVSFDFNATGSIAVCAIGTGAWAPHHSRSAPKAARPAHSASICAGSSDSSTRCAQGASLVVSARSTSCLTARI